MSVHRIHAMGWIVLIGALWLLMAHALGWETATIPNALVFGCVIYWGFRAAAN